MRTSAWIVGWVVVSLGAAGGCKRRGVQEESAPAVPVDPHAVVQVAIGAGSACAVIGSGAVHCWGDNSYGQLGDGSTTARLVPGAVLGLVGAVEVDVGDAHACARKADGSVWCWGTGSGGALGNNSTRNSRLPVRVAGLPPVRDIGTSGGNTCAVATDRGVWCWGSNAFGESAQPAGIRDVLQPTRVAGLGPAAEVDTGQNHACARLVDGTVWCWGGSGPLGDGAGVQRNTPVQVAGIAGALGLAVGQNHNCALLAGGTVSCWGSTGGTSGGRTPTPVALTGVTNLTAGNYSTCALRPDGVPLCWGTNYQGKFLVPATQQSVHDPTPLPGVTGVSTVALGIAYQCAQSRTGPLQCWGTLRRPFGGPVVMRTATVYPVTFDGNSPPPPLVDERGAAIAAAAPTPTPAVPTPAPAAPEPTPGTPTPTPAAPEPAPTPAPTGAREPLAVRAARTTAVAPTPQEVTVGRQTLRAEQCLFDGPPLLADSNSRALASMAFDRRGRLHVIDGDQKLRRYVRAHSDTCRFARDMGFGQEGILDLPSPVSHVSVDRRGSVVASGVLGSFVIDEGTVTARCPRPSHGYVTMSPQGVGYGIFPGSPVRQVEYTADGCQVTPWTYENPFRSVTALAFDRRTLLMGGSMPGNGGNQVAVYDERGRERARFGNPRGTEEDGFCWVHGLSACRAGVCVIDTNCDRIHLWTARGQHLGNVRASLLFGVPRPWLSDIVAGRRGELFVATGVQRTPANESVSEGVLFLVSGM